MNRMMEKKTASMSTDMAEENVYFTGVNVHPGFAKNKMTNAVKMAACFLDKLPDDRMSPETTEGREQFVHPYVLEGGVPQMTAKILLRSFETPDLAEQARNGMERMALRYKATRFIVYFQSFCNTYAPVDRLKKMY